MKVRIKEIKIRFSPEEYEQFLVLSQKANQRPAVFARQAVLGAQFKQSLTPTQIEIRSELGKIGSNLNQISRHLNHGKLIGTSQFTNLRQLLESLQSELRLIHSELLR